MWWVRNEQWPCEEQSELYIEAIEYIESPVLFLFPFLALPIKVFVAYSRITGNQSFTRLLS